VTTSVPNLRRRLAMLKYHASVRDAETGKSLTAIRGGMAAWAKRAAATPGGARALGLEMALRRWHPDALENETPVCKSSPRRRASVERKQPHVLTST
jgi:hypothetical protein